MAYDEKLAARLRTYFANRTNVLERKMFGGLAFMVRGHMCVGVNGDVLMARVGPEQYAESLQRPHARKMDFTGKPLKGFIYVDPEGLRTKRHLESWVKRCEAFVNELPPK